MAEGQAKEALLTKFFLFEASGDRRTWTFVGEVLARDRDHAQRLFYGDSEANVEFVAVSENAWKPRRRGYTLVPKPSYEDVEMPVTGDQAAPSGAPALIDARLKDELPA